MMITYYNMWDIAKNTWCDDISCLYGMFTVQHPNNPAMLDYIRARTLLEFYRQHGLYGFDVRILKDDKTAGYTVGYQVWMPKENRWVLASPPQWNNWFPAMKHSVDNPCPLTYPQAAEMAAYVGVQETDIREINSKLLPCFVYVPEIAATQQVDYHIEIVVPPTDKPVVSVEPTFDFDAYNGLKRIR